MSQYRIDFTITRRQDGEDDFTEVGFGSSGAWSTIGQAAYIAQSIVDSQGWETSADMPEPADV